MADTNELIEHPTFLEHIRFFFEPVDIEHMRARGIDLATYEGVKKNATSIYSQTKSGSMPPEKESRWSTNRVKTFKNWIVDQYPMGVASPKALKALAGLATNDPAARRNVDSLSSAEIERLALVFRTIMERDPAHPQSYFALADIHWFPAPVNCLHHEERYNPWHRVFIDRFEEALQSVPGCENIKLPYWDVVKAAPAWLFQPPFDSYTLQRDAASQYPAGTKTERFSAQDIHDNVTSYDVASIIKDALDAPKFANFTALIERAHDDGHPSCGPAMSTPDIAAFDPIFWFFHCNWERMWWSWQHRHNAVTLEAFRQTLEGSDLDWLDTAPFNELLPFAEVAHGAIDATKYTYEEPPLKLFSGRARVASGNISADQAFRLPRRSRLSVRVKDIQRLAIPGTFNVHLMADGKSVARQAFFQGTEPGRCPSCVRRETVSVDIRVDRSAIAGKTLSVGIEVLTRAKDRWIALTDVGSPTINIRELLVAE
ncbi:tyrosinase family protein [Rhizobium leguminosarum]|uniref:tyrosinase family protein n=1 Tax=Rhizobium leguminosarum TaxID=384 RepID=UPI001C93D314|nr:tyrosinase family protein [Rhizobium leguminosarum]MBY5337009.1 tyrosinase family protein [Rhizobium leguminosarum]